MMRFLQALYQDLDSHPWNNWWLWLLIVISVSYLVAVIVVLVG